MHSAKKIKKRTLKRTETRTFEELELERLQLKYRIDIRNLPAILRSSKSDIFIFRYYSIRFYWRLIIWDKFINKTYKKVVTVDDVISWFHNTYHSKQDLSNLSNHLKNWMNVSNVIMEFFKELLSKNILLLIDSTSHNPTLYKYQVNPNNLNIFRDILKKIKWTKFGGTWSGMVYKCPKSTLEEHDLRLEDIKTCEKCKYFNGYVFEDGRKKSIKCRGWW